MTGNDILVATEAAAVAAYRWVGRGDKLAADKAATAAMRAALNGASSHGIVAIGEGKKDGADGLFAGEVLGYGGYDDKEILRQAMGAYLYTDEMVPSHVKYSIAVDPIEGTTPTSTHGWEAMSVIALGHETAFYQTEDYYMDKLAARPYSFETGISLDNPPKQNVLRAATAAGKYPESVVVCLLDRPRNKGLIEELRKTGCRVKLIPDCDVSVCLQIGLMEGDIDLYMGVGGAPEAVISAAVMKCLGGLFMARRADPEGKPFGKVMNKGELAKGEVVFCATGITDGKVLNGVRSKYSGLNPPVTTDSILMSSHDMNVRRIKTDHGFGSGVFKVVR